MYGRWRTVEEFGLVIGIYLHPGMPPHHVRPGRGKTFPRKKNLYFLTSALGNLSSSGLHLDRGERSTNRSRTQDTPNKRERRTPQSNRSSGSVRTRSWKSLLTRSEGQKAPTPEVISVSSSQLAEKVRCHQMAKEREERVDLNGCVDFPLTNLCPDVFTMRAARWVMGRRNNTTRETRTTGADRPWEDSSPPHWHSETVPRRQ